MDTTLFFLKTFDTCSKLFSFLNNEFAVQFKNLFNRFKSCDVQAIEA